MSKSRKPTPVSLAPDTLDLLERVLDARLPPAYRDWLATRNGQMPESRVISFMENGKQTDTRLHCLYAVNSEHDYDDLWHYNSNYGGDFRPWYLSIGSDPFGNAILLAVKGPNHRQVFFSDHEVPFDVGLHFIAPSFEAFMDGMTEG
ncbi:SMI1 / KNR4 family protein [Aquimixticola soesokkakensis]|uniref:SMI1 / KNR4 family protein n=1 Tax=Aquimixticola soesokkakensis TaxID=1519096 RepID=A0A1Y5TAN6_9RHOB|nr:SMI1/KNR4 family protein [Aquimixticola soesokkakensis]SLN59523.1 SMI1 / KNR4 family protein [Aquimixticola soesokkakensis]